jgi:hypothetical protein
VKPKQQKTSPLERAAEETRQGRLWRAKEILSGHLACNGYSPEALAAYGRVLAQMHDDRDAGKYLFLSGLSTMDEQPLTELWLTGVRGKPHKWIFAQFPSAGKRDLDAYPETVRQNLLELGFPKGFKHPKFPNHPEHKTGRLKAGFAIFVGVTIIITIIVGLIHGAAVIGGWIFG